MKKQLLTIIALCTLTVTTMAQVPSYVPSNGLVGWWPFNGNANDESGNGNNGAVNGATLTTDRFQNANAAYSFDGSASNINIPHSSSLNVGSGNYTIALWVSSGSNITTSQQKAIFAKERNAAPDGYQLRMVHVNTVCTSNQSYGFSSVISGPGGVNPTCSSTCQMVADNSAPINVWKLITVTRNSNNLYIYVDGVLISTDNIGCIVDYTNNLNPWVVGAALNSAGNGYQGFFDGKIDDIGFWNRALTQQEVTDLYLGCANPFTATVTPNGSTTICSGGFVQLTASAGDSYLWSNGATTQSITVTQAGQYSVTVTNNDGCTDTSTPVTVSVNPTPSAAVTVGGATTFCTGGSVTLTAQGTGSYLWSNGATSQSITATQGGNYSVTVTNNGCSATSGVTTVTVNPTPTASIAPQGNTTFCQGGFVVLQASGGGTYQWNTGAQSSSISVSQGGTYTVVVSQNGCTAQAQQQLTVNPLPSVSLQPIAALCANASAVALTGGSPAGGSYTVNGTPATTLNPAQTGSGQQTVVYSYTNGNGCSNTATQSATVNAVPSVSLSGLNTAYLPTDAPVQLNGSPAGGVFNGTGVSNGQFDPAVAGLGTHSVSYAVVDGNGCIGVASLCATIDVTVGIGGVNIGSDGGVDVYPNPSTGQYTLELQNLEGLVSYIVYDSRGREVSIGSLIASGNRTQHNIDLNTKAKGIYTLQLQTAQGTLTHKLVKN